MTTAEVPVLGNQIAGQHSPHRDTAAPTSDARIYTECGSYKEAKVLASSRQHEGTDAYAVYVIALGRWCVR